MSKRRRPWGLMGLLSLGGLVMMGAGGKPGGKDDELDDDDEGGDNPFGDLPPPPPIFEDEDDDDDDDDEPDPKPTSPWRPGAHIGKPSGGGGSTPTPTPTRPGPKPPVSAPTKDEPPVYPPPPPPPPEPEDDDPPWAELVDPYPHGGVFYPVVEGDRFGGTNSSYSIAYRYLLSEAYVAALDEGGLDHEDASAWALAVAKQDKLRLKVIDLIQCSGWNDAMYGAKPVQDSHASKHGRSILLRPVHGPTLELLEEGLSPFRNITMKGAPADDDYRRYELLWQPAIDRTVLWESGGQAITTTGMEWSDGTTMENPPPWVMALGIEDLSGALVGDFGCPGSDGELEVG